MSLNTRNKMHISAVTYAWLGFYDDRLFRVGEALSGSDITRSIGLSAVGASLPNRKMILATIFLTAQTAMHRQSVGEAVRGYKVF